MIIKKSKKVKNKQNKHSPNNDGQSESKKGIIQQHSNVPINISKTRFPIIEECCNELQYKIVESNSKALIFWCDAGGSFEFASSLSQFQFCNHFPGTWSLARKVDLARNIGRLNKILPNLYNFHPKSFIIPSQYSDLELFMNEKKNQKHKVNNQKERNATNKEILLIKTSSSNISKIKNDKSDLHEDDKKITFIIKPDKGSFGRGIILIQDPLDVSGYFNTAIAQQYIEPYLIDGLKFDLRIYALVVSIDPLRIYLHKEGLARFCTEKYEKPSEGNLELSFAHLTNYALNKNNPNFQQPKDDDGLDKSCHKRSMQAVLKQIEAELHERKTENNFSSFQSQKENNARNTEEIKKDISNNHEDPEIKYDFNDDSELMKSIEDIIRLTIISVQPYILSCYKTVFHADDDKSRCFEILGFDIMIDEDGKPWLLEVNWSPSFADESPFDVALKKSVIKGALKIINVPSNFRKCIIARRKAIASRKPVQPLWNMEEELEIAKNTNYKLIYPLSPNDDKYTDTEMALFESKNAYQHLNNCSCNNNSKNIKIENGKSKSYNSFNLNDKKERNSPRNISLPRENIAISPLFQKQNQVKIIPPISRPNAPIAPRQQHLMNVKNSKSFSQPLFPVQSINSDESLSSNPDIIYDTATFYQKQFQLQQKRIKSPRRLLFSSKDEANDSQPIDSFPNQLSNASNNQLITQLPTVSSNEHLKLNANNIKGTKSNFEIHQKNLSLPEALPKLITENKKA